MPSYTFLLLAVAGAAGAVMLYAFLRRVMRAANAPRWLTMSPVAYGLALVMTNLFAVAMIQLALAANAFIGNIVYAGVASFAIHICLWVVARMLVPLEADERAIPVPRLAVAGAA